MRIIIRKSKSRSLYHLTDILYSYKSIMLIHRYRRKLKYIFLVIERSLSSKYICLVHPSCFETLLVIKDFEQKAFSDLNMLNKMFESSCKGNRLFMMIVCRSSRLSLQFLLAGKNETYSSFC